MTNANATFHRNTFKPAPMTDDASHSTNARLLEMAARMAGVGHWRFDMHTAKLTWSAETFRIHGLPEAGGEIDYATALSFYDAESAQKIDRLVRHALATGEGYEVEAKIRRPDGVIRHVVGKAECALDSTGAVEALFGIFQDVTERTQAERFMRALTDNIPALVAYWDADLVCRYANLSYVEWFGRTSEQMLGLSLQELLGPHLFAQNETQIRDVMAGQRQAFERAVVTPSGKAWQAAVQYIPDIDTSGQVIGLIAMVTDITALKATASRLKQASQAADEALLQAHAALAVKREFLSNISHELRNPLTGIIGFAEVLASQSTLAGEASSQVEHIRRASADLLATINDLLDFSRLEAGQVAIDIHPADPHALGSNALGFFKTQMQTKNLSHAFEAEGLPAFVMTDQTRIRQILLNLIGNAVKFTASGAVTLQAAYDRRCGVLRYSVCDTGPGVPPEHQSKLFQRFSQVDASSARSFGGAGLGLAICKGLAEAMGGAVGFTSTAGQGSQFWVEIPCQIADPAIMPPSGAPAGPSLTGALQNLRVLVVDDHPIIRELLRQLAEPMGVTVASAAGGADGVVAAWRETFDVILLDVLMPGIDGPSAARMIRSSAGPNQATPIIAFTAGVDRELPADWSPLFNDMLAKPFSASDLFNLLARHAPARSSP